MSEDVISPSLPVHLILRETGSFILAKATQAPLEHHFTASVIR